jgi:NAD(P)H-quinone oxidoreductase subunit 5
MHSHLGWFLLLAPLALVAAAAFTRLEANALSALRAARIATLAALAVAALGAIAVAFEGGTRTPTLGIFGAGLGVTLDGLSAAMALLVAFIGVVVVGYSRNYLAGDPGQVRFTRLLLLAIASVLAIAIAGNLAMLLAAWIATGLVLNRLLLFYPERRNARLAAFKERLVGRLGDLALAIAVAILAVVAGGFDLATISAAMPQAAAAQGGLVTLAGLLIVVAAVTRCAQFPLHGWLMEVMETPTPVSALLHAGVVNAGGFLVLRLADVMVTAPAALIVLAAVGGISALFASLVMLTQTSVKVSLAWSTVAQMGFMLLQCGLQSFGAAFLHIVAHSLYKAHAFLSSGGVIDVLRTSWSPSPGGQPHPARLGLFIAALVVGAGALALAAGFAPLERPGPSALAAILAIGLAVYVVGAIDERWNGYVVGGAAAAAIGVGALYLLLQAGAERLLADALPAPAPADGAAVALAIVVVIAFAALAILQTEIARRAGLPFWRGFYVHLSNGLYVNTWLNRQAIAALSRRPAAPVPQIVSQPKG